MERISSYWTHHLTYLLLLLLCCCCCAGRIEPKGPTSASTHKVTYVNHQCDDGKSFCNVKYDETRSCQCTNLGNLQAGTTEFNTRLLACSNPTCPKLKAWNDTLVPPEVSVKLNCLEEDCAQYPSIVVRDDELKCKWGGLGVSGQVYPAMEVCPEDPFMGLKPKCPKAQYQGEGFGAQSYLFATCHADGTWTPDRLKIRGRHVAGFCSIDLQQEGVHQVQIEALCNSFNSGSGPQWFDCDDIYANDCPSTDGKPGLKVTYPTPAPTHKVTYVNHQCDDGKSFCNVKYDETRSCQCTNLGNLQAGTTEFNTRLQACSNPTCPKLKAWNDTLVPPEVSVKLNCLEEDCAQYPSIVVRDDELKCKWGGLGVSGQVYPAMEVCPEDPFMGLKPKCPKAQYQGEGFGAQSYLFATCHADGTWTPDRLKIRGRHVAGFCSIDLQQEGVHQVQIEALCNSFNSGSGPQWFDCDDIYANDCPSTDGKPGLKVTYP